MQLMRRLPDIVKNIEVTINPDNSITVEDDGRGIPVGMNHKAGKSALEVVYTVVLEHSIDVTATLPS